MKFKLIVFAVFFTTFVFGQTNGVITGTLTDKEANNAPLAFANAAIKGTSAGATTNEKGKYKISIAPGKYILVLSFIGYEPVEIPVTVKENETLVVDKALGFRWI